MSAMSFVPNRLNFVALAGLVIFLFIALSTVPAMASATVDIGSYWYSSSSSDCHGGTDADPIGVLFRGRRGSASNVAHEIKFHSDWNYDVHKEQHLKVNAGNNEFQCREANESVANKPDIPPSGRYHTRLWFVPATNGSSMLMTVATPHHEDLTSCGHAVDQNGPEGSGFDKGRRSLKQWFENTAHSVEQINPEEWGNSVTMHQCDGGWAGSDGWGVRIGMYRAMRVHTAGASNVQSSSSTLNGHLETEESTTEYWFGYGSSPSSGSGYPSKTSVKTVSGSAELDPSQEISLTPHTNYYARLFARNQDGEIEEGNEVLLWRPGVIEPGDDNFGGAHVVAQANGIVDVFYRTPGGGLGHSAYVHGNWETTVLEGSVAPRSVPHAVVQTNGTVDVFYRTPSGGLGHNAWVPGSGWQLLPLPGEVAGDPHPVAQDNGTVDVFYRTPSGGLGHNAWVPGSGWQLLPLPGNVAGEPYPTVQENGTVDVFYRTPSGGLGHNAWVPGSGWQLLPLPGEVAGDPHPVAQDNGTVDVFYRTPSGGLGHNAWVPGSGWQLLPLPGEVAGDPRPVVQDNGTVDVFYRTPSGGLGHNAWVPGSGWQFLPLPGSVSDEPFPVVQENGTVDVFYRTPSGGLGHNAWVPGSGWQLLPLPGSLDPDVGMGVHAVAQPNGTVDVFYRTPSGGLGHDVWLNGIGWQVDPLPGELYGSGLPRVLSGDENNNGENGWSVTDLTHSSATLHASVDPEELATTYRFEYGTTSAYGSKAPLSPGSAGSGSSFVEVGAQIKELKPATTYHFRIAAENVVGVSYGLDHTFTTPESTEYKAAVNADTPVSYWRLGETSGTSAGDERGANPGTYQNSPTLGTTSLLASDTANKAVSFDGTNDSVKVPSSSSLQLTSSLSLEAWVKPASLPTSGNFASILTKAESYSLQFNGPRLEFTIMQGGVRKRLQAPEGAIVVDQTYHVVGTYDGTTQRLYINGTQVASTALSGPATTNTNALYLGSWDGGEEFFKGTIDEPAVYGSVLSAPRIAAHYEVGSGSPPPPSYSTAVNADTPVSYWRLGETSGTSAGDERGANPGTYQNSPTLGTTSLLASDTANKAVSFDGTNDSVKVPSSSSLQLTSSLSLEAWVKPASLPTSGNFASILTKAESYSLQFNGPRLEFTIMQGGVRKRLQAPEGAIVVDQTYHVVGTYDGTTQRLYINGTQVASTALSGPATTNTNALYLGSWDGGEEFFKGTIDEPAVYGSVLSAPRIAAHYEVGSGSPPPPSYSTAVNADTPVSYWRLGETSGTSAGDERGANPGTYQNSPTLGTTSLLASDTANKAVSFDGTNDSVKVPSSSSLQLTSSLSLEAWVKPASLPTSGNFASILTKAESYSLQFNGPRLEFTIMQGGVRKRLQAPEGAIVVDQTYHVVGTYDGTTQRLYINGTQVASTALSGPATTNTNALYLGSWDGGEEFFKGTIDEPAVYGSVLSATRVGVHYESGK